MCLTQTVPKRFAASQTICYIHRIAVCGHKIAERTVRASRSKQICVLPGRLNKIVVECGDLAEQIDLRKEEGFVNLPFSWSDLLKPNSKRNQSQQTNRKAAPDKGDIAGTTGVTNNVSAPLRFPADYLPYNCRDEGYVVFPNLRK